MASHEKELAAKELKMVARRTRIEAAHAEAARLAQQQADETAGEDTMDMD
jgi:hypothetical protein